MKYYLGVDGGGTKTEFVWVNEKDEVIHREIRGSSNPNDIGKDRMIADIVNGRIQKIYKEQTLLNQAFIKDQKISVAQYLASASKTLTVTAFKRVTLNEE